MWCYKHLRHTIAEKYDNNAKGGYFRFDDDNNMSYRYMIWEVVKTIEFDPMHYVQRDQQSTELNLHSDHRMFFS